MRGREKGESLCYKKFPPLMEEWVNLCPELLCTKDVAFKLSYPQLPTNETDTYSRKGKRGRRKKMLQQQ